MNQSLYVRLKYCRQAVSYTHLDVYKRQEADLSADQYLKVVSDAIRDEKADLVDVEISHGDDIAFMLISLAHEFGIKTIASSHDFSQTPKKEQIIMTLCKMQELEADIPKMAVMPQRERDVLVLLDATLSMKELHAQTPVITMAMGRNGEMCIRDSKRETDKRWIL